VRDSININKYNVLTNTQDRVSYLRALAINALINEAVEVFMINEEDILKGSFSTAVLDKSKYEAQINDIIKLSVENIYQSKEVIDKEIAGYEVITQLLDTFIAAINNTFKGEISNYNKLILKLIPETIKIDEPKMYKRLIGVCHYVSLLSDSQAVLIFKKLKGFQFN